MGRTPANGLGRHGLVAPQEGSAVKTDANSMPLAVSRLRRGQFLATATGLAGAVAAIATTTLTGSVVLRLIVLTGRKERAANRARSAAVGGDEAR
jgi:hypothetical protein